MSYKSIIKRKLLTNQEAFLDSNKNVLGVVENISMYYLWVD